MVTADHIKVKGRFLAVVYDASGTRYKGYEAGLSVVLDGKVVAHTDKLGTPLEIDLSERF